MGMSECHATDEQRRKPAELVAAVKARGCSAERCEELEGG